MGGKTEIFTYKFLNPLEEQQNTISFPVEVPYTDQIDELVHVIESAHLSPALKILYESSDLKNALKSFVKSANQRFYDQQNDEVVKKAQTGDIDLEMVVKNLEKLYKSEVLEHAEKRDCPTDNEIFAQSWNRLVHSSTLPDIIEKENSYAKVISEMTKKMHRELESLANRHQYEMDDTIDKLDRSSTSEDVNRLLSKQYSTQSLLKQKWESELESYRGFQRHEFRNWIVDETLKLQSIASNDSSQTPLGNRSLSMFVNQTPSMEESFTIHLGSQLKHNHNIRILSATIEDMCGSLHEDEQLGGGLNAALGLYSSCLCGIVLLTPSGFVKANEGIVKNCNKSTEFHFEQIDRQIEKIQGDLDALLEARSDEESLSKLKPGDFFITRHSNISSHVIFHLISDETFHSPNEINSRHPVILGLRNIIRVCTRYDVTTLTIPALLRHEMTEDMTVLWCMRRAELVFKCAKGFMIESASWGGSELTTLQLLLPHDISSDLFQNLTGIIPTVFRVANAKVLEEDEGFVMVN